jgi:MoxR-like ATPase
VIPCALVGLRRDLSAQGITASDRRWRQSLGLLRAHALLEGRAAVEEDDLAVLRDVLWAEPPQRQAIGRVVARLANPTIARAVEVGDEAQSVFDAWAVRARDSGLGEAEKTSAGVETVGKLRTLSGELKRLREGAQAQGRSPARVEREAERVRAMLTQVASEALGL